MKVMTDSFHGQEARWQALVVANLVRVKKGIKNQISNHNEIKKISKRERIKKVMTETLNREKELTKLKHQWETDKTSLIRRLGRICKTDRKNFIGRKFKKVIKAINHHRQDHKPSMAATWIQILRVMSKIQKILLQMRNSRETKRN